MSGLTNYALADSYAFMDRTLTRFEALKLCATRAGSESQLARDLGIPQPTMWRMIHESKQLRHDLVLAAERLYEVSRHDLRPDIYPREEMIDRHQADRFCGIDRQIAARQHMATSASKAA